jgi:hypothetical protein
MRRSGGAVRDLPKAQEGLGDQPEPADPSASEGHACLPVQAAIKATVP